MTTFALSGVSAQPVWVEVDLRLGLPGFTIVGLADMAVREARERVRAALTNAGYEFPLKRLTANLAPASVRKAGPAFDLPLAVAILVASEQLDPAHLEHTGVVGELSLSGEIRPVPGALAYAEGARAVGLRRLVVPAVRAREAALVPDLEIIGVSRLEELVAVLRGESEPVPPPPVDVPPRDPAPDFADVRGHDDLVPILTVAAAGAHNLFLSGPPGTGKTMIARRLPTILPPLTRDEAIEVTRIHSVAGLRGAHGLVSERPFRAPHHTVSAAGLVGGAAPPQPGEATLAHQGVLFLDELPEFPRPSLEALRQPLEDGRVVIVRGQRAAVFPTRVMLVAAANPCPCGGVDAHCRCTAVELGRHQRKLSGPLLDRIDIRALVLRPSSAALRGAPGVSSADLREQVTEARERALRRLGDGPAVPNARLSAAQLRADGRVSAAAVDTLGEYYDRSALSARGHIRVLRLARTVADLAGSDRVVPVHVEVAAAMRNERESGAEPLGEAA